MTLDKWLIKLYNEARSKDNQDVWRRTNWLLTEPLLKHTWQAAQTSMVEQLKEKDREIKSLQTETLRLREKRADFTELNRYFELGYSRGLLERGELSEPPRIEVLP